MALIHCHFFSHVLETSSTLSVILPDPGLSKSGLRALPQRQKYPTLYLLHGISDDHTTWLRRTSIERYAESFNLAVVMPSVQRSFYTDMVTGQRYWTFVSDELPTLARSYFPLSERREENYVAGLSMGGYGAFKLALTYPNRYIAAASLSGALDIVRIAKAEQAAGRKELKHIFGDANALAGSTNDLFYLAEQLVRNNQVQPSLYQWCGRDDFFYKDNLQFWNHMKKLGLAITYQEGYGSHEWHYWDQQIQQILAWLPSMHNG